MHELAQNKINKVCAFVLIKDSLQCSRIWYLCNLFHIFPLIPDFVVQGHMKVHGCDFMNAVKVYFLGMNFSLKKPELNIFPVPLNKMGCLFIVLKLYAYNGMYYNSSYCNVRIWKNTENPQNLDHT